MNLSTASVHILAGARGGYDVRIGTRVAATGVKTKPAAQKAAVTALEALGVRSRDAEALAAAAVKLAPKVEPVKAPAATRATRAPIGGALADDVWRYFVQAPNTMLVPVRSIVGTRVRQVGIADAAMHLRAAYLGARTRLEPLQVEPRNGGRYTALTGNSVLTVARANGWDYVPVKVRTP